MEKYLKPLHGAGDRLKKYLIGVLIKLFISPQKGSKNGRNALLIFCFIFLYGTYKIAALILCAIYSFWLCVFNLIQ